MELTESEGGVHRRRAEEPDGSRARGLRRSSASRPERFESVSENIAGKAGGRGEKPKSRKAPAAEDGTARRRHLLSEDRAGSRSARKPSGSRHRERMVPNTEDKLFTLEEETKYLDF